MSWREAVNLPERHGRALLQAYARRKQWEARQFGVSTINALAEAMGGEGEKRPASLAQLAMMGFGIRGI